MYECDNGGFCLSRLRRRNDLDFSCLAHFFEMTVKPKVLGVERADDSQMVEIARSLLQRTHNVAHSATTTS